MMDPYNNAGGSFLGLGFSHHAEDAASTSSATAGHHQQQQYQHHQTAMDADSLMKFYLQQCLDFHDEQQKQHQNDVTVPQFVTAQEPQPPPPPSVEATTTATPSTAITDAPIPDTSTAVVASDDDIFSHPSTQEAIAKARSIVLKFQNQQHQQRQQHSLFPLSTLPSSSGLLSSPEDYRHRRMDQLAKERQRLHNATLKNFEYVARREEERLQQQLAQLQHAQKMEQELHHRQSTQRQERQLQRQQLLQGSSTTLSSSKSGIGTLKRKAVEKQKQQTGHAIKLQDDLSVAIYLSGLAVDDGGESNSNNNSATDESFLRQLFASYGSIRRVHIYRHKQTGHAKGDALVVYNVNTLTEKQQVLDAVCSQMNGAELPCGSILHVEPADPQYKLRRPTTVHSTAAALTCNDPVGYYGPTSSGATSEECQESGDKKHDDTAITNGEKSGDNNNRDDDDLDDFFDSLA